MKNPSASPPIQRNHLKETSLSFSQESLWFLQQLDPDNVAYNMTFLLKFTGGVDPSSMEQAFNEMLHRHETLRTVFPNRRGTPVQVILPFKLIPLLYQDFSGLPEAERPHVIQRFASENGRKPYDLQHGPLLRVALVHATDSEDYLFFSTHHINFDGWSRQIFFNELMRVYAAIHSHQKPDLPEPPVQYADYAVWQRQWLSGETLKEYTEHWKNFLSGRLPILDLPTDRPRPTLPTYQGARHYFHLPPVFSTRLREFCRKEHKTPFQLFLAAYTLLLMRYSGQEDIIIGCPFANRTRQELYDLVGHFVNTLPIRMNIPGDPSAREFVNQASAVMIEAYPWQTAPFEALVSELSPDRDPSRTPVFQVMINMTNIPKRQDSIEGLQVENVILEDATAAFDISLELDDEEDHFSGAFRYNTNLFNRSSIVRMANHFQNLLTALLDKPQSPISALNMLTTSERLQLVSDGVGAQSEIGPFCIHELITQQAIKNPEATAVICNANHLTYSALEGRACHLAAELLALGIKPGDRVGFFLPRTVDLLVVQLAVLKMGGIFVSFDPSYPRARLTYILQDTNPALVITRSSLEAQIPGDYRKYSLDMETNALQAPQSPPAFAHTAP